MAEPPDSVLELLRNNGRLDIRNKHVFLELISRRVGLPMPVMVFADDLALKDLKKRKLEVRDLLSGCGDIFRKNGLDFSYEPCKQWVQPLKWIHCKWFGEYLDKGMDTILNVCMFEGQDLFLQVESSVVILLTGHLNLGNGCASGTGHGLRGRGIMVVGTKSYDFWRDIKETKEDFFFNPLMTLLFPCFMLMTMAITDIFSPVNIQSLLATLLVPPLATLVACLFFKWVLSKKSDLEYLNFLFHVIGHEQGHLFGLEHVNDERSVMFPYTSTATYFDGFSKKKLQKALRRCSKINASLYKVPAH